MISNVNKTCTNNHLNKFKRLCTKMILCQDNPSISKIQTCIYTYVYIYKTYTC